MLLNPAGPDYDYGKYWGAARGLDLNTPPFAANAQQPYRPSDRPSARA